MKFEDFKVGMKVRNINSSLISEVIGITTTGTVTLLFQGSEYVRNNYHDYIPYMEKKKTKVYHRMWKYDNSELVYIQSSISPPNKWNGQGVTIFKDWEEEIEYEVKD